MTELYHQLVDEHDHPVKRWMYGHYHASHKAIYDGMTCQLLDINEIVPLPNFDHLGKLAGCWKDCEEMDGVEQVIRESRTSGLTRHIVALTDNDEIN